jgi:hypothetical protein
MQSDLLGALRARQPDIRARWAELLRIEPVSTPLAHPEALAHLIDWTLEEIFHGLADGGPRRRLAPKETGAPNRSLCPCGRNPLLAYFDAADQALREALILTQAASPPLEPIARDASLEELNIVLHFVARREIEAFCGVCHHRHMHPAPAGLVTAADHAHH